MEIAMKETVKVNAKVLKVYLKVSDCFSAGLYSAAGNELKDYEGYVPSFMPGEHFGDYVDLEIDIDTGQILNWKTPTPKQIEDFIRGEKEEE